MYTCKVNTFEFESSCIYLGGMIFKAEALQDVVDCDKFLRVEPFALTFISDYMPQMNHDGLNQSGGSLWTFLHYRILTSTFVC